MRKLFCRMPNTRVLIALVVIILLCPIYMITVLAEDDNSPKITLTTKSDKGTPATYSNIDYYPSGTKFTIKGTNLNSDDNSTTTTYTVQVTTDGKTYKDVGNLTTSDSVTIDSSGYSGLTNIRIMLTSTTKEEADNSAEDTNNSDEEDNSTEGEGSSGEENNSTEEEKTLTKKRISSKMRVLLRFLIRIFIMRILIKS